MKSLFNRKLVLSAIFAASMLAQNAFAQTFNIDISGGTTSFEHSKVESGAFDDLWIFNVNGVVTADGILSNFSNLSSQNIDFTSVTLNGVQFDISNMGPSSIATLSPTRFTGPLMLVVHGISGEPGTNIGGSYSGNLNINVAAVPEPETYAMLLAGLGLIGFSARKRNIPTQG